MYVLCTGELILTVIAWVSVFRELNLENCSQIQVLQKDERLGSVQLESRDPVFSKWKSWRKLKLNDILERRKI
jgi:hypothetical protein